MYKLCSWLVVTTWKKSSVNLWVWFFHAAHNSKLCCLWSSTSDGRYDEISTILLKASAYCTGSLERHNVVLVSLLAYVTWDSLLVETFSSFLYNFLEYFSQDLVVKKQPTILSPMKSSCDVIKQSVFPAMFIVYYIALFIIEVMLVVYLLFDWQLPTN